MFFFVDIPDIPDDIRHLRSLQIADFSSNPIPKLPAGFSQLKSLTILGLNDMSLTSLPADFGWWVQHLLLKLFWFALELIKFLYHSIIVSFTVSVFDKTNWKHKHELCCIEKMMRDIEHKLKQQAQIIQQVSMYIII